MTGTFRRLSRAAYRGRVALPSLADSQSERSFLDQESNHVFRRGTAYILVHAGSLVVGLIVTPLLTRQLGGAEYGALATAMALGQLLSGFVSLGLQVAVQRAYATEGSRSASVLMSVALLTDLSISAAAMAGIPLWGPLLGFRSWSGPIPPVIVWAGVSGAVTVVSALVRSQDRLGLFLGVNLGRTFGSQASGLAALALWGPTASVYLIGLAAGQLATLCASLVACPPAIPRIGDWSLVLRGLKLSVPVLPHGIAVFLLVMGDRFVVRRDLGLLQVGRYQVAYTVAGLAIVFLGFVNQSWEPRIYEATDPRLRRLLLVRMRLFVADALVPVLLGIALASPLALRLLAPGSYDPAHLRFVVLYVVGAAIPYAAYAANMRVLLAAGQTRGLAWMAPAAGILNIGLNLSLVPLLGINGSALATLVSYGLLAALTGGAARAAIPLPRVGLGVNGRLALSFGACALITGVPDGVIAEVAECCAALACLYWLFSLIKAEWVPSTVGSIKPDQSRPSEVE